jgi:hypothetical protein
MPSLRRWIQHFDQCANAVLRGTELGEGSDTIARGDVKAAANYMLGRLIPCAKNNEVEPLEFLQLAEKLYAIIQKCKVPVQTASFESLKRRINDDKEIKNNVFINDITQCDDIRIGIIRAQADTLFSKLCKFANKNQCSVNDYILLSKKIETIKRSCDLADKVALYVLGKCGSEGVHPAALLLKAKVAGLQNSEFEKAKEKITSYMKRLECFQQGLALNQETAKCVHDMHRSMIELELKDKLPKLRPSTEEIIGEVIPTKSPVQLIKLDSWDVYNFATQLLAILNSNSEEKLKQIGDQLSKEIYHFKISATLSTKSPMTLQDLFESHLERVEPDKKYTLVHFERACKCVRAEALLVMLREYVSKEDHKNTVSVLNVLEGIKLDPQDLPADLDNLVHALHDKIYSLYNDRPKENAQNNIDPNHWKLNYKFGRIAFCGTPEESVTNELKLHLAIQEGNELNESSLTMPIDDKGKDEMTDSVDTAQTQIKEAPKEAINDDPLDHGNVQKSVPKELKIKALDMVIQALAKAWAI